MALAGCRAEIVQPLDLLRAELYAVSGGVLLDAGDALGAGNRCDVQLSCWVFLDPWNKQ
jgi:hypothetical protein